ncbi:flavodoxin domain-containing protein [Candidatus Latescibacterota bacterium]
MKRRNFITTGIAAAGTMASAGNTPALNYYPMPSDKKIVVIYGTWCGSSRDAAVWISEGLGGIADVYDVRESPNPSGYDHIIIGGSIRNSVTPKVLQDYIGRNTDLLRKKVLGLFAVCGNLGNPVGPKQKEMLIDNHLAKLCNTGDVPSKVFLGRVTKTLMDLQTAEMMQRFDDYDNLKRAECMAFGKELMDKIR